MLILFCCWYVFYLQVTDSVKQLKSKYDAKLKEIHEDYEAMISGEMEKREQDFGLL